MKRISFPTVLAITLMLIMLVAASGCYPPPTPTPPASSAASTNSIQNIVWQWTSLTNRDTQETTPVPDPGNYTIVFYPDGRVSGAADCNTFTGAYSQENGFSITLGAMTTAACGDDSLDAQYVALLGEVAAGGPDGAGGLALETAGGQQRMSFVNGGSVPSP